MCTVRKERYSVRDHGTGEDMVVGKYGARVAGVHSGQKLEIIKMTTQAMDREFSRNLEFAPGLRVSDLLCEFRTPFSSKGVLRNPAFQCISKEQF